VNQWLGRAGAWALIPWTEGRGEIDHPEVDKSMLIFEKECFRKIAARKRRICGDGPTGRKRGLRRAVQLLLLVHVDDRQGCSWSGRKGQEAWP